MPVAKLKELLDREKVKYVSISHSMAYTAQEIAASAHIPGREIAKSVMVKVDDQMIMAVVPATARVELDRLRELAGGHNVALASEEEFKALFPECATGAMPPFGRLYGMELFVDRSLAEDEEIAFNAGSHAELIRMSYKDFERLAQPIMGEFVATPVFA
jgi:Ala-tRNA(Pro) deacylase